MVTVPKGMGFVVHVSIFYFFFFNHDSNLILKCDPCCAIFSSFNFVVIFNVQLTFSDVSWCYIENVHKIERTEDRATRIITWTHFKYVDLLAFVSKCFPFLTIAYTHPCFQYPVLHISRQLLYWAPLCITLKIRIWVVAYFFNFFQLFQKIKKNYKSYFM